MSINTGTDITGLSANTSYTYSLYPINTNGQQSTIVTQISFVTLPTITSATVSTVNSYNSITLSIAGAYSSVLIEYSTNGSSYNTSGTTSSSSVSVTSLSANQRYYFKLTPYNSSSVEGTVAYISDTNSVTLGYIDTFTAPSVGINQITLNWTGIYSSVIIYYGLSSSNQPNSKTISSSSTSLGSTQTDTITDLTSGTTYYFTIYPYNSNGLSGSTKTTNNTTNVSAPTDSMIYYYKFETGDITNNTIANYATGTAVYGGTVSAGSIITSDYKVGTSCYKGSSTPSSGTTYIKLPNFSIGSSFTGFSVTTWFKFSNIGSTYDCLFCFINSWATKAIWFEFGGNYNLKTLSFLVNDNQVNYTSSGTTPIVADTWYHFGITLSTSGSYNLYINNQKVKTSSQNTPTTNITFTNNQINCLNGGGNSSITSGTYDDFRVYSRELSSSEIDAIYKNTA